MSTSRIPDFNTVKTKVKGCLFSSTFVAESFRGIMMGIIITVTLGEVVAYRLLKQNIKAGDMPHYVTDLLILLLALLEALVSPFIGWLGSSRRRGMLMVACLVSGASALLWFALPTVTVPESIGFCNGNNTMPEFRSTFNTPIRLSIILYTFLVFGVTRIIVFCHGITYMDNRSPSRLSMHYGVLTAFRLLGLEMGYNIMTTIVETNLTIQIFMIAIGIMINALQIYLNTSKTTEEMEPKTIEDDLSFGSSVYRVFSNTLITTQMVSMGLIAAALWGFAYHQTDFLKAKYYIHVERSHSFNYAEILRYHFVILAVVYQGLTFTPPIMPSIIRLDLLTNAAKMCFFSVIVYVMLMVGCDTGSVAGLQGNSYTQPQCSQTCGCAPQWQEFAPLCVADQMTTYLSPCHAGCSGIDEVDGLQVYANCTCASFRRAIIGACSGNSCEGVYQMHQILYPSLIIFAVLYFQAQGTLLLRVVEPRDKSVLLGLAGAFIALFTFVFGHLIFIGISNLLILLLALLEALLSPFIGWLGSNRRRGVVVTTCLVSSASALMLFVLPKVAVPESVEFGLTPSTPFRLSLILYTLVVFGIPRVIIICHGIIYMDNRAPARLSMHFGVLSTYRLMSLVVAYNVLTPIVETNLTVQILLIAVSMALSGLQIYVSTPKPKEEEEEPKIIMNDTCETSPFVPNVVNTTSSLGFGKHVI
ncbi:Solute carrier organic anion transporter family member 2B1 [Papilio machaon]|uniref:Solute carrier organic anion transporter family member 2B1 n=1 Tax=Papilio machaon TaxID=76193 RepID=A0A194RD13_PAPMA|nr:Solute carrier organic anion transporter family member 2B1 [Papilio machaon]